MITISIPTLVKKKKKNCLFPHQSHNTPCIHMETKYDIKNLLKIEGTVKPHWDEALISNDKLSSINI